MSLPSDILFFQSKSAKAVPGRGVNESVANPTAYVPLNVTPDWRKMLSNFWSASFTAVDGHRYNTVEHYFQAKKLAAAVENFEKSPLFQMFCIDAPNAEPMAMADGSAAQKRRKFIKLSAVQLADWDSRKEQVMYEGQLAKFSQNEQLKTILLATGNAQLWHGAARQPRVRMETLERVRDALRQTI